MDERDDDALHAAFQEFLGARPEPPLPSVVDAAVAGGRRIRRRRVVFVAVGTLVVVACTVTVATTLSGDAGHDPRPIAPAATPHAKPSETTTAPPEGSRPPGGAQPADGTATGGGESAQDSDGRAEPAHTGAQRSGD
ncbi:hypothetical protein [Streptomyces sp. NPDC050988]|uniref:hypothetical protein n=1 Tax=Streptomyces sp. NPDC050988 TaxID=3365637 RepID=UPI0037905838